MALFKSKEEKEQIAKEKQEAMLKKYGLEDLSDPRDIESVRKIMYELAGSGLSEFGALLSNDIGTMVRVNTQYVNTVMEQNFIIIRQLDKIVKLLEK